MKNFKHFKEFFFLFGCAIMLNYPAFLNGYPLVTSDSGTYMVSGLYNFVPFDRPIIYGFFVRHLSMKESMWFVIIAQGLIAAWVMSQVVKQFLPAYSKRIHRFFIFLGITILTTLPWFSSQLMADFFSPFPALCMALLLIGPNQTKSAKIFTAIILLFSLLTHNSHLLSYTLVIIILGLFFLIRRYFKEQIISKNKYLLVLVLIISGWFVSPFINYLVDGKYRMAGAPHVFLVARFAESGILEDYLKKTCSCTLEPEHNDTTGFFIFSKNSYKCIEIDGFKQEDFARLQQWTFVNGPNQKFQFIRSSDSLFAIRALHSRKVLSVYRSPDSPRPYVVQAIDSGVPGQRFKFIKKKANLYMIQNSLTNDFLDVKAFSKDDGGVIHLFPYTGQDNQLFKLLPDTTNKLCFYQGQIPRNTHEFLWTPNSVLERTGGWNNSEKDYSEVSHGIVTSPRYFLWNVREAVISTLRQLVHFDIGSGLLNYGENSSPGSSIKNNYSKDFNGYITSMQNSWGIYFVEVNKRIFVTMITSLIILLLFFLKRENFGMRKEFWMLTLICIYSVVINAFVCGAMANVLDRLQSRIVWLLPFCALLIVYEPLIIIARKIREKIMSA